LKVKEWSISVDCFKSFFSVVMFDIFFCCCLLIFCWVLVCEIQLLKAFIDASYEIVCTCVHAHVYMLYVYACVHTLNNAYTPTDLNDHDLTVLAKRTESYSGSDISVAVREALMEPIRKVQRATHYKKVSTTIEGVTHNDCLTPCSPRDQGAMVMNWMDVPGDKLVEPQVTRHDFEKALSNARPSVNADDLKRFEDFTNDFGQEG